MGAGKSKAKLARATLQNSSSDGRISEMVAGIGGLDLDGSNRALLKQVFKYLVRISSWDSMDKELFIRYFPLNGMLAERLFVAFDQKNSGKIDEDEFIGGLQVVLSGTNEEKARLMYNMFNLDGDDGVSRHELRTILTSTLTSAMDILTVLGIGPLAEEDGEETDKGEGERERDTEREGEHTDTERRSSSSESHTDITPRSSHIRRSRTSRLSLVMHPGSSGMHKRASYSSSGLPPLGGQSLNGSPHFYSTPATPRGSVDQALNSRGSFTSWRTNKEMLNYQTVEQVVENIVTNAFESCDVSNSGKLNFAEFSMWLNMHPGLLDAIFGQDCFQQHRLEQMMRGAGKEERRGYLSKHVGGVLRPWKTRLYELRGTFLFYYDKERETLPSGAISLVGAHVSVVDRVRGKGTEKDTEAANGGHSTAKHAVSEPLGHKQDKEKRRWGVEIVSGHLQMVLYTDTHEDAAEWCEAIKRSTNEIDIREEYDLRDATLLGQGGFATVYKVREYATKDDVAIKVISKVPLNVVERAGLLAEIAVLKLANHPNIVRLREVYDTTDTVYLVMELCRGGELFNLLKEGPLSEAVAVPLVAQLFQGLGYLHDIGVVHRDIKPTNILLTGSDPQTAVLKIVDFGFSKFVNPSQKLGDFVGTLKYNAPEVLKDEAYNKPVDMWSAGIIVYILLTNMFPFFARSEEELVDAVVNARYNTTCAEYLKLSYDAKKVITSLLQINPKARPTAQEVLKYRWFRPIRKSMPTSRTLDDLVQEVRLVARASVDASRRDVTEPSELLWMKK